MATTKARLSNGNTITVDNTQIDIKFTRSVQQLDDSLSRAQNSMGLYYDQNRRLVDVLGRCVEGLSLSQIRLGMWVDETGKARTVSGGYADGLSRVQLELGHYADALGNIHDQNDRVIGKTKEAIKADEARAAELERQAEAQKRAENEAFEATQRARAALGESAGAIASSSSQFAVLLATLEGTDERVSGLRSSLIQFSQGVSTSAATVQTAFTAYKGISEAQKNGAAIFSNFTAGTKKAALALKDFRKGELDWIATTKIMAATLGPAAIAVGALGAGVVASFLTSRKESRTVEGLKDVEIAARNAGKEVKTLGDALTFGAFNAQGATSGIRRAVDELNRLNKEGRTAEQALAIEESWNGVSRAINKAGFAIDNFFSKSQLQKEKKEQFATINAYIAEIVERNKTESERIADELKTLQIVAKEGSLTAGQKGTIQAEIKRQEEALAKAKAEEANAAQKKAQAEKDELERETGARFQAEKTARDAYNETLDKLTAAKAKGTINEIERQQAEKNARAEFLTAFEKENGVAIVTDRTEQTARESFVNALDRLTTAKNEGILNEEEFQRAEKNARADYLSALEKEIGVSFAKPETNAPLEKFRAQTSRLDEELKSGNLDQSAYDAAKANAQRAARDALGLEVPKIDAPPVEVPKIDAANFEKLDAAKTADAINAATAAIKANAEKILANADAVSLDEYRKAEQEAARALEAGTIDAKTYARQIADAANATAKAANLAPEAFQTYKEEVDKATRAAESGVLTEIEKNAIVADAGDALAKAREEAAKNERDAAEARLGIDALISEADAINDAKKGVAQRLKEQEAAIKRARDAGEIADADFRRAQRALTTIRNKQADEERTNAKEKARSALGIDSLMESMKTPFDNFAETLNRIDEALKSGAINANEAGALQWKARADLFNKTNEKADKTETLKESTKESMAQTLRAGSNELYLAQVRNATSYQTSIKSATERLDQTTRANLDQTRQTNYWLEQISKGGASIFYGV